MPPTVIATATIQGMKFYTCEGTKCEGDERLYLTTVKDGLEGPRVPLTTPHLAYMLDHYYKNEERRYPRAQGFYGGGMVIECMHLAGKTNWQAALEEFNVPVPRGVIYGGKKVA